MEATPARYEWRAWADRLDDVAARIGLTAEPDDVQASTEIYIVSERHDGLNVKVRADQLDVKRLRAVRDGFEQWEPQLKTPFPITAGMVRDVVSAALGRPSPPLARSHYTLEQLIEDVVADDPNLTAVTIEKRRRFSTVAGCAAEVADVVIAGRTQQTAAVESADLGAVREAQAIAGLDTHPNISYPVFIKRLLALGSN